MKNILRILFEIACIFGTWVIIELMISWLVSIGTSYNIIEMFKFTMIQSAPFIVLLIFGYFGLRKMVKN